ncbi:hypothetical protein JCM30237_15940 [Halolamina litorea]|uniref:Uncharacterized protein n=1 Tax=Halolamina litorea TaxID=1515593 RepID=A0ABD6BN36_9EURY|nr:hypothetical protein [Halolamina litorea]
MQRRQYLSLSGLALTTGLAGCTAPDAAPSTPAEQVVSVTATNDSDRTLVFTVAVVAAGFGGLRLTEPDGEEKTFPDAETVEDVPNEAWERAVTFTPLGPHQRQEFRSTSGSGRGIEFDSAAPGSTVVVTIAAPDETPPLRSISAGACGTAARAEIAVRVDAGGVVSHSTTCTDAAAE